MEHKERPILFNGEMVRAIRDGRKTQTRRVVNLKDLKRNPDNDPWYKDRVWSWRVESGMWTDHTMESLLSKSPYGKPGDRLWGREHHARVPGMIGMHAVHYFADGPMPTVDQRHDAGLLRSYPSIHMPRWASRLLLEIVAVRVERLQDISEEDAMAEGASKSTWAALGKADNDYRDISGLPGFPDERTSYRNGFATIWHQTGGDWAANPWVWVIEFKRI